MKTIGQSRMTIESIFKIEGFVEILAMDLRRIGFSVDGLGSQCWICMAATSFVSEGFCFTESEQPDSYRDMGAHHQLRINGALDASFECAQKCAHRQHENEQPDSCAVGQ